MKKNIIKILVLVIIIKIILNYDSINICIINTCILFFKKIFPSMFLMFILSSLIIELNLMYSIKQLLNKITTKLFNINYNTSTIFFISLLTGCPNNAKVSKELYEKKYISKLNIQKILLFSHFINPFFILNNIKYKSCLVLFSHYISNVIIGILLKNKYKDDNFQELKIKNDKKIYIVLFDSINKAISTSLFILGTIITFNIISSSLNINFFNIILEVSTGINYLYNINLSLKLKTIFCGMLLSFGGLCIHMQIYGIISELKIKYIPYLLSRILHSIITGLIIYILY